MQTNENQNENQHEKKHENQTLPIRSGRDHPVAALRFPRAAGLLNDDHAAHEHDQPASKRTDSNLPLAQRGLLLFERQISAKKLKSPLLARAKTVLRNPAKGALLIYEIPSFCNGLYRFIGIGHGCRIDHRIRHCICLSD